MSEFQDIKGVPLVVRDEETGEARIIPYNQRTDFDQEPTEVINENTDIEVTYNVAGLKFPTEEARHEAIDDLNTRQDRITDIVRERWNAPNITRPIGATATTKVISPPSRLQMHIESDKEHTDNRRTS